MEIGEELWRAATTDERFVGVVTRIDDELGRLVLTDMEQGETLIDKTTPLYFGATTHVGAEDMGRWYHEMAIAVDALLHDAPA